MPIILSALLLIVLGVLFSTWLRIHVANSDPLWLDELHSVWATQHEFLSVHEAASAGNQAPLYFWILKAIPTQNPPTPMSVRWFSILCAALLTISIACIIYNWTRSWPATVLAVFLTAIDPNFIFYGSEARPYALLMLIALWQFFAFSRIVFSNSKPTPKNEESKQAGLRTTSRASNIAWLVILSLILILTHHTGVLLLATEMVIATTMLLLRRTSRRQWLVIAGVLSVTGICVLAAQGSSISNTFRHRNQWSTISSTSDLLRAYTPALIFLVFVPLVILGFSIWRRTGRPSDLTELTICSLAWAITPALLAGFCDWVGWAPLALYRYTLVGAIACPVFAALSICWAQSTSIQAIAAASVLALSVFGPLPQWRNENSVEIQFANQYLIHDAAKLGTGDVIRRRYESWDSAVNLLKNSDAPIFLFANLLEDEILEVDRRSRQTSDPKLVDYLKFPLSYSQSIDAERIIPRPSHSGPAFLNRDLGHVAEFQEFWIVIRGDPRMVQRILDEAHSSLQFRGHSPTYDQFHFANHAGVFEWITVVKIKLPALR